MTEILVNFGGIKQEVKEKRNQPKDLILKFTIADLQRFAPAGIEFKLNERNRIQVIATEYKTKYPKIDSSNYVFNTTFNLDNLDTVVGKYLELGVKKVPIDFENKKAEEIYTEKFYGKSSFVPEGVWGIQEPLEKYEPIFGCFDIKKQFDGLEEYGTVGQEYEILYKQEKELEEKKAKLYKLKPKSSGFGRAKKYKKWSAEYNDLIFLIGKLDSDCIKLNKKK